MVWAVILAAGESKRMGEIKQLLPFKGKTILEAVIEISLASHISQTVLVLGAQKEIILKNIKNYPIITCVNKNYRSGMLSSIKCGLKKLPDDIDAAIVMLGDQPSINSKIINNLIDAHKKSNKGLVIPVYHNKRGHPILVDMKYKKEILNISPALSLRTILNQHQDDILEVIMDDISILIDIDTKDEYKQEIKRQLTNL